MMSALTEGETFVKYYIIASVLQTQPLPRNLRRRSDSKSEKFLWYSIPKKMSNKVSETDVSSIFLINDFF